LKTIELKSAADARQKLEDLSFDLYHRMRSYKPNWELSQFVSLGFWPLEQVERFEKRYRG
jgi:hypothetical protein